MAVTFAPRSVPAGLELAVQYLASSSGSIAPSVLEPGVGPGLICALILLAAIAGGLGARLLRVPRVVGYLVAGIVLRYVLVSAMSGWAGVEDPASAAAGAGRLLAGVKTLALGLILFSMGSVFETGHIKSVGARVWKISCAELACVFLLVVTGCALACAFGETGGGRQALAFGVLLGCVALATAPAATILVLREYDAKGPVGDTIMTLTAMNNTVSVVLFHCSFLVLGATGVIDSVYAGQRLLWLNLLLTSVGSVGLGALLGFVLSLFYSKMSLPEFLLIFLAVLLGLGEGDTYLASSLHLSFNFLLTCLACGAVFANITMDQQRLHESLRTIGGPIFAAFFVLAGYDLQIHDLGALGWIGAVYVLARTGGKVLGGYMGARWAGALPDIRSYIGFGLLCQAGVAIGLADFLFGAWGTDTLHGYVPDPFAEQFVLIVLGSVVIFELVGPLTLKSVVVKSGEVKAISMLRRRRAAVAEGDSILKLTAEAFLRTVGLKRSFSLTKSGEALQARHIMRSNIKLVRDLASLDEVLHFVETSRFNHFPVVDAAGQYVGMIHFSDLREIIYDPSVRELVTAADLADAYSPTVAVDLPLEDLLEVFHQTDFGSLAVVESAGGRRVVGLVEQRDLLRALHTESKTLGE